MPSPDALPFGSPLDADAFDERNAFLDLLLGILSLSERTLASVTELAEPQPPPPEHRAPANGTTRPAGSILR